jgi:hypothetical protein
MENLDPKWIRVSSVLALVPYLGIDGKWTFPINSINPWVLQNAADRGTRVHEAINAHTKGEFFPLSDPHEMGYLRSFHRWEKEVGLKTIHSEMRLFYEPMNLTGCVDMIAELGTDGKHQIVDFKCTASEDVKKWPLQAALYEFLCQTNGIKVDKMAIFVQLDKLGGFPKIHQYEITKELTSVAISTYNLYRYLTNN